jgi:hypothetical protein
VLRKCLLVPLGVWAELPLNLALKIAELHWIYTPLYHRDLKQMWNRNGRVTTPPIENDLKTSYTNVFAQDQYDMAVLQSSIAQSSQS